nr:MAG TPA: hypothetical protein [Crassvirales sp.]
MGRPNRGTGSAGIKKPGNGNNGGGKEQYIKFINYGKT